MAYINPDVDDFKEYFFRDFPYGNDLTTVQDQDIENAITTTAGFINSELHSTQENYTLGFLLLTAHFMCVALMSSSQGINGQFSWLTSSKAVGSVSEGISIPDRILQNPELAMLSKTNYGARYLFMVLPFLVAPIMTACGRTKP